MKKQQKKVLGDVKSFTVNRKNWYRGEGTNGSCLLNNVGKMCCLGFYATSCGVDKKTMKRLASPLDVVSLCEWGHAETIYGQKADRRKPNFVWKTKLVHDGANTKTTHHLMDVNDNENLSDEEREKTITSLFKKIGIKVRFEGNSK